MRVDLDFAKYAPAVSGGAPDFYVGDTVRVRDYFVAQGLDPAQGPISGLRSPPNVQVGPLLEQFETVSLRSSGLRKLLPAGVLERVSSGPWHDAYGESVGRPGEVIRVSDPVHRLHDTAAYIMSVSVRGGELWYHATKQKNFDAIGELEEELRAAVRGSSRQFDTALGRFGLFVASAEVQDVHTALQWRARYQDARDDVSSLFNLAALNYLARLDKLYAKSRFRIRASRTELLRS